MQNDELQERLRCMQQQQQQQQQQLLLQHHQQQQQQQQQQNQRNSMLGFPNLGQNSGLTGLSGLSAGFGLGGGNGGLGGVQGFGSAGGFGNNSAGIMDNARFGGLGTNSGTGSQFQALQLLQQQQQQHDAVQQRLLDQQRRASMLEQANLKADNQKLAAALEQRKQEKNVIAPGGWQVPPNDLADRRTIIRRILEIIQQISPGMGKSSKLDQMAQRLEGHLYQSAKSKEDYMNLTTLKDRLQATAYGLEKHDKPVDSNSQAPDPNWSVAELLRNQNGNTELPGSLAAQFASDSTGLGLPGGNSNFAGASSSGGPLPSTNSNNHLLSSNNLSNTLGAGSLGPGSLGNALGSGSLGAGSLGAGSMNSYLNNNGGVNLWQLQQQQAAALDQQQPLPFSSLDTSNQASMGSLDLSLRSAQGDSNANLLNLQQQLQANQRRESAVDPLAGDILASHRSSVRSTMSDLFPQQRGQQRHPLNVTGNSLAANADHGASDPNGRRVIQQQQSRLLLLRHASKCTKGASCTTKFCGQMVTLWRHIKSCRDKNCKTPHCLSSRCVLNHYRMCRNKGETMTCEVCGPVMKKIKQLEREQEQQNHKKPSASASPSSADQELSGQQLQQLHANQHRLKILLESLQNLQRQQDQLLTQQRSIDEAARHITNPNTEQAKHVFQQQDRLQILQKKLHDKQQLVEKEVQVLTAPPAEKSVAATKPKQQAVRRSSGKGKRIGKLPRHSSSSSSSESKKKRPSLSSKDRTTNKKAKGSRPTAEASKLDTLKTRLKESGASLVASMTKDEIKKHLDSLNKRLVLSPRTVTHKCRPLLQKLLDHDFAWVFRDAVDPVELGLADYFEVVKNPMHLSLIQNRLENAIYSDMHSFAQETCLVFENAILYNGEQSEVGGVAQKIMCDFKQEFDEVVRDIESSHLNLENKGELCTLCGRQKRLFQPTMLYCQGQCGMQSIKRNASYYTDRTKQNHWCEPCYEVMKPDEYVSLDDGAKVRKNELQVFKNDHLPEEGWVNCDLCHSWVHQVCALFNGRANKSNAQYCCPNCALKAEGKPTKSLKRAADLPRCKLSDFIENGVKNSLQSAYKKRGAELGIPLNQVEKVEGTSVRVLANVDKKQLVGEKMLARYGAQNYPSEFPVRSKCIALFQPVHGVDTLLFALYVYEYGHDCPAPNRRRVYISYLDSVQYFEPKCYRTKVYQTIIVEYLRYVKQRGFHTAHIWSCPPTPGDDYIFYCHPKHQLVPREDMLRAWYHKVLDQAKAQGVVIRTTTLYDEYFGDESADAIPFQANDPTCLPYFEGDYIPGEIENIMTRGLSKSEKQDVVMSRIGENLAKMKENFIVVHLRNRRFAAAVARGEDVSQWKEDSDDEMVRRKKAKITGKGSSTANINIEHVGSGMGIEPKISTVLGGSDGLDLVSSSESHKKDALQSTGEELGLFQSSRSFDTEETYGVCPDIMGDELGPNQIELDLSKKDQRSSSGKSLSNMLLKLEGMPVLKTKGVKENGDRSIEVCPQPNIVVSFPREDGATDKEAAAQKQEKRPFDDMTGAITAYRGGTQHLNIVPDTTDEDLPVESEMFESRQQFLNYCQTTHCQFDELRRAKHSTIMVLFQLHNPTAPIFLQQCGACYNDITHGIRYHCNDCNNFDLCGDCYEPVITGLWAKRDPTFAHDKSHRFTPVNMEAAADTTKSLEERQKSLKAHVELVEHAASCLGAPDCKLQNCERMKKLFSHVKGCIVKPKKDCKVCTRLLALATMHTRMCSKIGSCEIPFCNRIRERNNRLRRQQQLMDDRRRQAQNELYHAGGES